MNSVPSGRTWDDASSPAAVRQARRYEEAWQLASREGRRLDPREYLASAEGEAGSRLAILRADLSLRWEAGDRAGAKWYLDRFDDLGDDSRVALIYEEFCLREEDGDRPDAAAYLARYPALADPLRRVLDIHELIGSATTTNSIFNSSASMGAAGRDAENVAPYPEAGQTIAGFYLVEELGRGSFARVFLARERELADRHVALKVTRRVSREPQALARLQHTHIVPVHSLRSDRVTGLHLLCMPYFGRVTLSRLLHEVRTSSPAPTGSSLVEALDRLANGKDAAIGPQARSASRAALASRTYARAIAWWGARLAEALDHAHDRGILHRDVKPSNVLVNDDGMPMLLDFNLARVERPAEGSGSPEATLGGTLDYMAPEHLEALADESPEVVDARSDIYGLGILLYEALVGAKPFSPPRRNLPIYDSLIRAATDRRQELPVRFPDENPVPAPFVAVIRRCLAPDPVDRYQTAGELAEDLRAVADDFSLSHAREPLISRVGRRLRRNRRRLSIAAALLLALGCVLGAYTIYQVDRQDRYENAKALYLAGCAAIDEGRFADARKWLDAAAQGAQFKWSDTIRRKIHGGTVSEFGGQLRKKLENLWAGPSMDVLEQDIGFKARMAGLIVSTREDADRIHAGMEGLRFRLIGLGDDVPEAVDELKRLIEPFHVLECREAGVTYERDLALIDPPRRELLSRDVNELLFLWMVGVEEAFRDAVRGEPADPDKVAGAVAICDRALAFSEFKEPWQSLRALLERHAGRAPESVIASEPPGHPARLPGEPLDVIVVTSPSACFHWGLLNSSAGRTSRALEWLQQAVRLDWSDYWCHFYLGYLANKQGLSEDALSHFNSAVARQPRSPWVLFNRARILRARGQWGGAIEDFRKAQDEWGDGPNSYRVALEMGVLHSSLGNFRAAETEYRRIMTQVPDSEFAEAARLNLAALDAESGREARALMAYDSLIEGDPRDQVARLNRAYLQLRLGRGSGAIADLDILIGSGLSVVAPSELHAARASAHILLDHSTLALQDAAAVRLLRAGPAADRLYQRALLAAGRYGELELGRPEEIRLLPVAGPRLIADLRRAVVDLSKRGRPDDPRAYRATLNLAVILSTLGDHGAAIDAARQALSMAARSPESHLILARILLEAGQPVPALARADAGLGLRPRDPELHEARGAALARLGRLEEAIASLDQATAMAPNLYSRALRGEVLNGLGRYEAALSEWSSALRSDPELPSAYLGRARSWIALRYWDRALADLEQASTWSHGDLGLESRILASYARCLRERPGHAGRWLSLLDRTAREWLRGGVPASKPTVVATSR
ncbi:serine/threonine-protein kinase [Aquisphaera insulae]|uniref:serine/threonine-protein kinase n=1 Tax=Aquisphaera insulae TaxID=2712864 RepID=UPI0013EB1D30|nr:serine/threonine-protein kinase [Aquisphaera insulae]